MAFNEQEQKIIDYGKQNGKSQQDVEKALVSFRTGQKPIEPVAPKQGFLSETWEDIKQTGSALKDTYQKTVSKMGEAVSAGIEGEQSGLRTLGQAFGAGAGGVSQGIGDVIVGGVKSVLPQSSETYLKEKVGEVVKPIIESKPAQNLMAKYEGLNPQKKRDVDAILGTASFVADVAGAGAFKKSATGAFNASTKIAKESAETLTGIARKTATKTAELLPKSQTIKEGAFGLKQAGKELIERVPRMTRKVQEGITEASLRAERIAKSTLAVGKAIKANVPEILIEGVSKANKFTARAMKKTLDLAEKKAVLGIKTQPSTVSGNLAVKQFSLINAKRASIGTKLGEAVDELSKTVKVSMQNAYKQLDDILTQLDIIPNKTELGIELDFSKSAFSTAQKTKIKELYKLAQEGGETLTPSQLYKKDQLFSQLSREAKMSEIGDVLVKLPGANKPKSLFSIFKDVYSKTLDSVSPQNIRALNKEYRQYRTMVDTIEDTLLRGGKKLENIDLIKKNPAEFAKVNLRRIFGDAASSAEFATVANEMDKLARILGYADANPSVIADFANELRKLYPATIPATGFTGGIKTGVADVFGHALKLGSPGLKDQQKALRELIESLLR